MSESDRVSIKLPANEIDPPPPNPPPLYPCWWLEGRSRFRRRFSVGREGLDWFMGFKDTSWCSVHPAVLPTQVLVESAEVQSGLAACVCVCVCVCVGGEGGRRGGGGCGGGRHCIKWTSTLPVSEWAGLAFSGEAFYRLVSRRTLVRFRFGSPLCLQKLWSVDTLSCD